MPDQFFTITVDTDHLAATSDIARLVETHGLKVDRIIKAAGFIRAIGDERLLPRIRAIQGIAEVRRERTYTAQPSHAVASF